MTPPLSREEFEIYLIGFNFTELRAHDAALRARVLELEQLVTDGQEAIGHWQGEAHTLQQQLATVTQERDELSKHQELHDRIFARQKLLLDDQRATITKLEGALDELKNEVSDCVEELIEQVLYPMNEGEMNPIKMDVCLAQLTQAVEAIYSTGKARQARGK